MIDPYFDSEYADILRAEFKPRLFVEPSEPTWAERHPIACAAMASTAVNVAFLLLKLALFGG